MPTAIQADKASVKFALSSAYLKRSRWSVCAALIVVVTVFPILVAVGLNPFGNRVPLQIAIAPLIIACLMLPRLVRRFEQQLHEISPPLRVDEGGILTDSNEGTCLLKWDDVWRVRIWRNSSGTTTLIRFDRTDAPVVSLMNYESMNELEQLVRESVGSEVVVAENELSGIQENPWLGAGIALVALFVIVALEAALVQIGGWKLLRVIGGVFGVVFGMVLIFFAPTSRLNPKRRRAEIIGGFATVVTGVGGLLIDILG